MLTALQGSSRVDRNRLLVEWGTAVFAIFWGVWWAYIADQVLGQENPIRLVGELSLPLHWVAIVVVLYVSLFTYFYVRWMWETRFFHWDMPVRLLVRCLLPLCMVAIGLSVGMLFLYYRSVIIFAPLVYGIALTGAWILTITLITFQAERWF